MSIRKQFIRAMQNLGVFTREQLIDMVESTWGDPEDKESILNDLAEHHVYAQVGENFVFNGSVA